MMTSLGTCRLVMPRVRVDHRDARAVGAEGRRRPSAWIAALLGSRAVASIGGDDVTEAVARVGAPIAVEHGRRACRTASAKKVAHAVSEQDRIRHLHHRRLQVQREQHSLLFGVGDLLGEERASVRSCVTRTCRRSLRRLRARLQSLAARVVLPSSASCSMRAIGRPTSTLAIVTDCSLCAEVAGVAMLGDVRLAESLDQAPMRVADARRA